MDRSSCSECTLWFFHRERRHERSRQGLFGQYCKPIFVMSDQVATSKKAGQRECKHYGCQRMVKLKQRFTKHEPAKTENRGPDDAMQAVTTIGLDIAKSVFQIHGLM